MTVGVVPKVQSWYVIPADVLQMLFYFRFEAINMRILDIIMCVWADSFIHISPKLKFKIATVCFYRHLRQLVGRTIGCFHFTVTNFKNPQFEAIVLIAMDSFFFPLKRITVIVIIANNMTEWIDAQNGTFFYFSIFANTVQFIAKRAAAGENKTLLIRCVVGVVFANVLCIHDVDCFVWMCCARLHFTGITQMGWYPVDLLSLNFVLHIFIALNTKWKQYDCSSASTRARLSEWVSKNENNNSYAFSFRYADKEKKRERKTHTPSQSL